jgi:hypothetical protein
MYPSSQNLFQAFECSFILKFHAIEKVKNVCYKNIIKRENKIELVIIEYFNHELKF